MKKFIFLIFAFFLTACASVPQTSEVLETSEVSPAPIPTPTLHPEFAALQETIAATGDRFTLDSADGLIYDGETPIPGLTVAPDGTMTLIVNGETVILDPADVDFDDEKGVSISNYLKRHFEPVCETRA